MSSDRELKVLHLLASTDAATQRQVADAAGLSLGLVNNIVHRLIETGHIKIQNLTAKRMRYILTPKGFAEKARQGYDYLRSTVKVFNASLQRISELIADEVKAGRKHFVVVGEGEIADLVETALRLQAASGVTFERRINADGAIADAETGVLDCRAPHGRNVGISVLSALLQMNEAPAAGKQAAKRLFPNSSAVAKSS